MNNVYIFTGVRGLENPAHATKFFLTSSLVGLLARVHWTRFFPQDFSHKVSLAAIARMWRLGRYFMMLISINCQVFLVDHTDTNKFSLFKIWSAFQEDSLLRKNVCRTHARANKTCQEKLGRVYEVYIRAFVFFFCFWFIFLSVL